MSRDAAMKPASSWKAEEKVLPTVQKEMLWFPVKYLDIVDCRHHFSHNGSVPPCT